MRLGAGFNKLVSFAIVWCMVISSFLGVLLIAVPQVGVTAQGEVPSGDMIIGTGYSQNLIIHNQGSYPFDGNLTIRAGGMVQIINSTAVFRSTYIGTQSVILAAKALSITIEDGGILILDNSTLTMEVQSGNPIPALGVVVRHGGQLESRTSNISFSGHLLVDDATLTLIDSTISGVKSVFNSTYFPSQVFGSSPVLMFMSSNVTMIGSKIVNMYDNGTYNTVLNAPYNNNYQFAKDDKSRQFVDYFLERDANTAFGVGTSPSILASQLAASMTMNDTKYVTVAPTMKLNTTGFDMGGLVFEATDVVSETLHVTYRTDSNFLNGTTPDAFWYTPLFGAPVKITAMTATQSYQNYNPSLTNKNVSKSYALPALYSAQALGRMALNFTNSKNSNVYIDRIWVTIDMRLSTYRNVTLGGSTNFIAADSYIQLNNINENNGTNAKNGAYHKLVALDQSIANLYGLTVSASTGGFNGTNVFKTTNHAVILRPDTVGPLDTTGGAISALQAIDSAYYEVAAGKVLQLSHFNIGDLNGRTANVTINVRYWTPVVPSIVGRISYSFDGITYTNSNITIVGSGADTTVSYAIPGKYTFTDLSNLRVRYNATLSTGTVRFNAIWLNVRSEPTVALYRWMQLTVTDDHFVPVNNVGVSASIIGTVVAANYLTQTGVATTPPQAILDYLGKTGTNYNRTGVSGFVKIPLLSDVLNSSSGRNGKAFDYNLVFKYRNSDGLYVLDDNTGGISTNFAHFPNMVNNADVRTVMFPTLSIVYSDIILSGHQVLAIGGSAPYQVKGNILIEDNATLIISSGTLKLLNDMPNQFKISVYGFGSINIVGGMITSSSLMHIFLHDNATLSAKNNSVLPGLVAVSIDGHARVTLAEDAFIGANFTAPSSSYGNLTATNVTFLAGLTSFGGHATAELAGVTLPSIILQDEAKAWNFRWLTVTVMDGTQVHGIPGAYVEVDRSAGAHYAAAKTGADGTVTFMLLSDTVTQSGAPHFDNYRLNATYWFKGQAYQSSGAILGRYTQIVPDALINNGTQIVKNDIVTSVFIPSALPELDPPFWASNYVPARGVLVNLTANVTNTGVVTAYNVLVRFKDLTTSGLIADRTITSIAPGAYSNITVQWTAVYPVGLHTLNVTVDPFGAIPQLDRSKNWNETVVNVQGVPDLSILSSQISVDPKSPVTNSTALIQAEITNGGDNMVSTAVISFYDVFNGHRTIIANITLDPILSGHTVPVYASWKNMFPGDHNITVVIDEKNRLLEASKGNNQAGIMVTVLNYPDLYATKLQFKMTSSGTVVTQAFLGDNVTLAATVMNIGDSPALDFLVRFWLGNTSAGKSIGNVTISSLASGDSAEIQTYWIATATGSERSQNRLITVEVNPFTHSTDTPINETDNANHRYDTDNIVSATLQVVDNRADLWFPNGVSVKPSGGTNTTSSAVIGQTIVISFTMANQGIKTAPSAVLNIYVRDSDNFPTLLNTTTRTLAGGESVQVTFSWVVNLTAGHYSLVVEMNPRHTFEESDYTNNIDSRNFTINVPNPLIVINVGTKTDFQPGESIYVIGAITNIDGNYALANQSVTIKLLDAGGLPVGQPLATKTDSHGAYSGYIFIPTDRSGAHSVSVTLNTGATYTNTLSINIVEIFKPQSVPLWIFLLIAAIVIAVILIFSVYLYKYGLGKMVECGECGALIPESSKRCPRCGTEFETETAKCSECGTWIPARSKECPECGAKFMTEPVEEISEDDYMASMRRQYDEYVNGFREQAKAALGKKYSEDKFMDWLKTEPTYMTFENWVAKQEEERKIASVPCPSCGTLNPKGAPICSKCGTVFERTPEPTQTGEQKPFRKIVKRSSDRKMVPKKVIKEDGDQSEQAPEEPKKE